MEWPDAERLQTLRALNEDMRACSVREDWTPLVRLNREFHLQIYSLSPYHLILEEVQRLWALADTFIATKMADMSAQVRMVQEHDMLLESLAARDMQKCLETMDLHRRSTSSGLPPEHRADTP